MAGFFPEKLVIWKRLLNNLWKKKILVCSLLVSCLLWVFDSPNPDCLACMHTAHMDLIKGRLKSEGAFPLPPLGPGVARASCVWFEGCKLFSGTGFSHTCTSCSYPSWFNIGSESVNSENKSIYQLSRQHPPVPSTSKLQAASPSIQNLAREF